MTIPEPPEEPRVQPSTGTVAPQNVPPLDGVVEPVFWEGLDVNSVGAAAVPSGAPQNEATFQWQQDNQEETA